jgi:hypothetical protein
MFVYLVFRKEVRLKAVHPLNIFQDTQFHDPALTGASFASNFKSSNVRHFGMVSATALKLWRRSHLQWLDFPTQFHKNILLVQNLMGGRGAHRRNGDVIAYIFL